MHPFMPFFQCYDWVQNASPKLLCFMCFWGVPKVSGLSIESKKSTQQHDNVKKMFLYYSAGPWRSVPPCCVHLSSFLMSLYILYIMRLREFSLQVLSTQYCPLSATTAPFEGCSCVVALNVCAVHMCWLGSLLLLWDPGIPLQVGTVSSPSYLSSSSFLPWLSVLEGYGFLWLYPGYEVFPYLHSPMLSLSSSSFLLQSST